MKSRRSSTTPFLFDWGNLRQREIPLRKWIMLASLFLLWLSDKRCGVQALPLEVEGELSELAGGAGAGTTHRGGGMAVRLIQEEEEEREEDGEEDSDREVDKGLLRPRIEALLYLHKIKQLEEAVEREEEEEALERAASESIASSAGRSENARALWTDDMTRRAAELCGTKASLDCGKRILSLTDGQEKDLSVHMKCDLREDFLGCIDEKKEACLNLAKTGILPSLPPKDVIKVQQSKLWKVLWTAGGCVLSN